MSDAEVVATDVKVLRQETEQTSSIWVGMDEARHCLVIAETKGGFRIKEIALSSEELISLYRHLTSIWVNE